MKAKLSSEEIQALLIHERVSAVKVTEKMRLPLRSNVNDKIDLSLTPYLRAPVSCIGDPEKEWIFIVGPTQSGKSVFLQIAVADSIYQDPGPLLYLFPDRNSGVKQFKEKILDMIKLSPDLNEHITGRHRDLKNDELYLDNMTLKLGWGGSLGQMSSTSYKRAILDEVRLMPVAVGKESNAIKFATDRMTTYTAMGLSQGYAVSTPSVEGDLLHRQIVLPDTNVLMYKSQCPSCGHYQRLNFFKHMVYDEKADKAICLCEHCREAFPEDKRVWNQKGVYAPKDVKVHKNGELDAKLPKTSRYVFWWDSMVSPFRSFSKIYNEYVLTRNDLPSYKNFIQCWLAMFWKEEISKTSEEALRGKIDENRARRQVPFWTKVLLAGIDTQDNGFYVTVYAFGDNRIHLVDHYFVKSDIEVAGAPEIYRVLKNQVHDVIYYSENGKRWQTALIGIDTGGHRTKEIYNACSDLNRMVMLKGRNRLDLTNMESTKKDVSLWLVKTEEYLSETDKIAEQESTVLTLHENSDDGTFIEQFVNIKKVKEVDKRGNEEIKWYKKGRCDYRFATAYCFAMLDLVVSDLDSDFRTEINKEGFVYNPLKELTREVMDTDFEEAEETEWISADNW